VEKRVKSQFCMPTVSSPILDIGEDGSAIRANLVKRKGSQVFSHMRTITQMNWCRRRDTRLRQV